MTDLFSVLPQNKLTETCTSWGLAGCSQCAWCLTRTSFTMFIFKFIQNEFKVIFEFDCSNETTNSRRKRWLSKFKQCFAIFVMVIHNLEFVNSNVINFFRFQAWHWFAAAIMATSTSWIRDIGSPKTRSCPRRSWQFWLRFWWYLIWFTQTNFSFSKFLNYFIF